LKVRRGLYVGKKKDSPGGKKRTIGFLTANRIKGKKHSNLPTGKGFGGQGVLKVSGLEKRGRSPAQVQEKKKGRLRGGMRKKGETRRRKKPTLPMHGKKGDQVRAKRKKKDNRVSYPLEERRGRKGSVKKRKYGEGDWGKVGMAKPTKRVHGSVFMEW